MVRLLWLPFLLQEADGTVHQLVPHEHTNLLPLFGLIGAHVSTARITPDRDLELSFDQHQTLTARELDDGWEYHQPWQFGDPAPPTSRNSQ